MDESIFRGPDSFDQPAHDQRRPAAPSPGQVNPFARPGSHDAFRPATAPGGHTPAAASLSDTRPQAPTQPRAAEEAGIPSPRRSAASSTSPSEPLIPAPRTGSTPSHWTRHYRRTIALWVIAALLGALALAGGIYAIRRFTEPPPPGPNPGAPTPTDQSASPTAPPLTEEHLLTVDDANKLVSGANWSETATATDASEAKGKAACLSDLTGGPNPLQSLQRTLASPGDEHLAALHQVDIFATHEAADKVFRSRVQQLSRCDAVPARIVGTSQVKGFADQSLIVTVAYENDPTEYHVVHLSRSGRTVTILDAARDGSPVPGKDLTAALTRSQQALCKVSEGGCPGTVGYVVAPALPTKPPGWLIPADLPRFTAGTGLWIAGEPGDVSSRGTACEGMTLASVNGPQSRQQATYLLTQDDRTPEGFGLDVMQFDFASPQQATAFHKQLADNLATCKQRTPTATVTEYKPVSGVGGRKTPIQIRMFSIKQSTSSTSAVLYQTFVGVTGNTVFYGVATVTGEYLFTEPRLGEVALRQGERTSQKPS